MFIFTPVWESVYVAVMIQFLTMYYYNMECVKMREKKGVLICFANLYICVPSVKEIERLETIYRTISDQ